MKPIPLTQKEIEKHIEKYPEDLQDMFWIFQSEQIEIQTKDGSREPTEEEKKIIFEQNISNLKIQQFLNAVLYRSLSLFQDNSGFYYLEEATKSGSIIKYRDRKGIIYETGIKEKPTKNIKIEHKKEIVKGKLGCDARKRLGGSGG